MTHDVAIVGGGIVGASCAHYLAKRGLRVVVFEREAGPAMGSTGKSAAGVRVQFTSPPNIGLSMYSLPVYRSFLEQHGHDVGYRDIGYLLLVPHAEWDRHLESVELQRSLGAPVDVLDPEAALRYVPFNPEGIAGATFGPWDGVIDPHMATVAWVSLAREAGVEFRFGAPVTGLAPEGDGWTVRGGGDSVSTRYVVNAAGAWAGEVGQMAGLTVPVLPKRIQIFLSAPISDPRTYPLTIDLATGVYLRSEGDRIILGLDDLTHGFGFSEGMDWEWLEHVLLTGVDRFSWWEELGIDRKGSWWGYYEVTPDNSPIIAPHPNATRWIDVTGFSGHGIMHAPAAGLAVSEMIADGASHTVDVSAYGHARFDGSGPIESNIF